MVTAEAISSHIGQHKKEPWIETLSTNSQNIVGTYLDISDLHNWTHNSVKLN